MIKANAMHMIFLSVGILLSTASHPCFARPQSSNHVANSAKGTDDFSSKNSINSPTGLLVTEDITGIGDGLPFVTFTIDDFDAGPIKHHGHQHNDPTQQQTDDDEDDDPNADFSTAFSAIGAGPSAATPDH